MVNFPVLLLFLLGGAAQTARNSAVTPAATCTVEGVVAKAGTGEALHKADVELWSADGLDQHYETLTDNQGSFGFRNVAPGRYRLAASRTGYVRQEYGQTAPEGNGSILTLSPGEKAASLSLQLLPAAVISGRIVDEDGDPVEGAEVQAMRPTYSEGQRKLAVAGEARTDDRGDYRIFGLTPGQYFIEVEAQPRMLAALKSVGSYPPFYYPGVADSSTASPITVRAGDEFSSADISLQSTQTVTLRGHVSSSGNPAGFTQVLLVSLGTSTGSSQVRSRTFVHDAQGAFELHGITPGSYILYAFRSEGGRMELARLPLELAQADVDGINLALMPGIDIRGRLRVDPPSASPTGITVMLTSPNAPVMFNGNSNDSVKPDGSFLLRNVFDGEYDVLVRGFPPDCYVKSVRWAGVDGTANGIKVDGSQTSSALDIVISANGGRVDGVVQKDQQPFAGARVTLVPDAPQRGEMRLFKSTSTDQTGRYVLRGIAPGDYKLFAWESVEEGAEKNPEFLLPYESQGESVHVDEGAGVTVPLDVIPSKDSGQ